MKANDINIYDMSIISTIKEGDLSALRRILKTDHSSGLERDELGFTVLMWAATYGREKCVELLLPVSEPNASNRLGRTALMLAANKASESCVARLIPVSNAWARDGEGQTALMRAAVNGNAECVELLLPVSEATARDRVGMTALDIANYERNYCIADLNQRHLANAEALEILGEIPAQEDARRGKPRL